MTHHCSLYELNSLVQSAIEQSMQQEYWVEAELSEANERRGHLFLDLIQKDSRSNTPIARAQAKCWASTWMPIRSHFERITGQSLKAGMKVLLQVYPQFHPAYGFSWIVTDIDPTFTLGDMAQRRQEIIQQLKEEGVFELQKELRLPLFCQHIAVISSETAAGYGDFCNQLADNDYGFKFTTQLFPAIMQGEKVEQSIIAALNRIMAENDRVSTNNELSPSGEMEGGCGGFDCVVIIRGGGATTDMSGFDTLPLAENVANFPLPIITGIGHDRDECILDMVSNTRVKTPTAAAAFLIDHLAEVYDSLETSRNSITQHVQQRLETERIRLTSLSTRLPILFSLSKTRETARLDQLMQQLKAGLKQSLQREQHHIELLEQRATLLDPQLILNRGYSMTMSGGKVVTDAEQLIDGEIIETRLSKGTITSKVWKKQ